MYNGATAEFTGVNSSDARKDTAWEPIDAFIERMEALDALGRRHQVGPRPRRQNGRATSNDGGARREKVELVFYMSANSEKSLKALRAVRAVLARYQESQIKFSVCDLSESSTCDADGVVFTPTLVKRSPGPRTWIVGNLDHPEALIDLLDVSGVDRRR